MTHGKPRNQPQQQHAHPWVVALALTGVEKADAERVGKIQAGLP